MIGTALADTIDQWDPSIPSTAKPYSLSDFQWGFTTTRYLSKPTNGFGSTVYVSSDPYITWDGYTDYDFFEYVKPKDQNGNYLKSSWGMVYSGYSGSICYSILTMSPSSSTTRVYLRVENPGYTNDTINWYTGEVIDTMDVSGDFWS
jgi:hypothetical protein